MSKVKKKTFQISEKNKGHVMSRLNKIIWKPNFINNGCVTAFYKEIKQNWQNKKWVGGEQLILLSYLHLQKILFT